MSFTDIDGNLYTTVVLGTQEWTVENLRTTKLKDGTAIAQETDDATWWALTTAARCWYNNDEANKTIYGALYNWHAVNTGKLAPAGWRIPTATDWATLATYLGGDAAAGGKLKETGTTHWATPNTGATNETGFTALGGGWRGYEGGFGNLGELCSFWSSTAADAANGTTRRINHDDAGATAESSTNEYGLSVRCVREVPVPAPTGVKVISATYSSLTQKISVVCEAAGDVQYPVCRIQVSIAGVVWTDVDAITLWGEELVEGTYLLPLPPGTYQTRIISANDETSAPLLSAFTVESGVTVSHIMVGVAISL